MAELNIFGEPVPDIIDLLTGKRSSPTNGTTSGIGPFAGIPAENVKVTARAGAPQLPEITEREPTAGQAVAAGIADMFNNILRARGAPVSVDALKLLRERRARVRSRKDLRALQQAELEQRERDKTLEVQMTLREQALRQQEAEKRHERDKEILGLRSEEARELEDLRQEHSLAQIRERHRLSQEGKPAKSDPRLLTSAWESLEGVIAGGVNESGQPIPSAVEAVQAIEDPTQRAVAAKKTIDSLLLRVNNPLLIDEDKGAMISVLLPTLKELKAIQKEAEAQIEFARRRGGTGSEGTGVTPTLPSIDIPGIGTIPSELVGPAADLMFNIFGPSTGELARRPLNVKGRK